MKYTATLSSQSPHIISVESEEGEKAGSFLNNDGRVERQEGNLPRGVALEALMSEPSNARSGTEWEIEGDE